MSNAVRNIKPETQAIRDEHLVCFGKSAFSMRFVSEAKDVDMRKQATAALWSAEQLLAFVNQDSCINPLTETALEGIQLVLNVAKALDSEATAAEAQP
jgi:hypothetical protein